MLLGLMMKTVEQLARDLLARVLGVVTITTHICKEASHPRFVPLRGRF